MCTNASAPDYFFDTPGKPYGSLDINPGTLLPLHMGTLYPTKVTVHNSGMQPAPATVKLWVCPPGTNVIAGTAFPLGEANTASDVPACTGTNNGTTSGAGSLANAWTVVWDPASVPNLTASPGNTVHMCLFAQVRYDGSLLGSTATAYPTNSDPNTPQNAQHNIDVIDAVYPFKRRFGGERFFGFGIVNATERELLGQIASYPVTLEDEKSYPWLFRNPRFARLLEGGKLRAPTSAGLVLGRERIIVPRKFDDEAPPKRDPRGGEQDKGQDYRRHRRCHTLGNTGVLDRETFSLLAEGKENKKRAVALVPGEVRQGMIHLVPPPNARPGDLFVVDIRHEVATASRGAKTKTGKTKAATKPPKTIGGLVVILRVTDGKTPNDKD